MNDAAIEITSSTGSFGLSNVQLADSRGAIEESTASNASFSRTVVAGLVGTMVSVLAESGVASEVSAVQKQSPWRAPVEIPRLGFFISGSCNGPNEFTEGSESEGIEVSILCGTSIDVSLIGGVGKAGGIAVQFVSFSVGSSDEDTGGRTVKALEDLGAMVERLF